MIKLLTIVAVIVAIASAAPFEKRRVSFFELLARSDPFHEKKSDLPTPSNVTLLTVTQRVDNFDPQNFNTWEQRYYMNNEFYEPGSPIFLFLAGEWTISAYRTIESLMYDMADELNANILYLEHRFYGESHPTPDASDENLRFLSPEQALADAAHFVNFIQRTLPGAATSNFIVVGGHYSASLAVWFRQRYPHLASAVWASSAPLLSVVEFDQFKVATGEAYRTVGGDSCYDAIELGFSRVQDMIEAEQWEELTEAFYLCDIFEPEDVPLFFSVMTTMYATIPFLYDEDSMEEICAHLELQEASAESIAIVLHSLINPDEGECVEIDYDYIIENERRTEWNATAVVLGFRQWTYQVCSELGWFTTTSSPDQPFGNTVPLDTFHDSCVAIFGETFTPERINRNSDRLNTLYGGLNPDVTNAIFVHGQHDPWSVVGRRTDLNDDAIAIIIPGVGLSRDLGPISDEDPAPVAEAKVQIQEIIRNWVAEFSN